MRLIPLLLLAAACSESPLLAGPIELQGFQTPTTVGTGSVVTIPYTGAGVVDFYADADGDLATTNDQVVIATGVSGGTVDWNTAGVPPGTYRIVARGSDGVVVVSEGMVTLNAAPTAAIIEPAADTATNAGNVVDIDYVDDDPDDDALTSIFADGDGDPATTNDQLAIVTDRPDGNGATQAAAWSTLGVPPGTYTLFVRTRDAVSETTSAAPRVTVVENVAWLALVRGNQSTGLQDVQVLADGSMVVTGAHHHSAFLGGVYVARYRSDGTLDWETRAMGHGNKNGHAIDAFADGSCLVTGAYTNALVFGSGETNETTLSSVNVSIDGFLARYNADGTLAWALSVGGTELDSGYAVAALADGSCVLGGSFGGTVTFAQGETAISAGSDDAFLARYDADGALLWAIDWGSTGLDSVAGLAEMPDGSVVVTGYFEGSVVLGAGETNETTLTSDGDRDIFVARFESDGTLRWARRAGGAGLDFGQPVAARADGSFLLAGGFSDQATFDSVTLQSAGGLDFFVAGFDGDGNVLFARGFGGVSDDYANRIATQADGSIAIAGFFPDPFAMGPFNLTTAGDRDILTAVLESDGSVRWARSDGGGTEDLGRGVGFLPDGSVVVAGIFALGGPGGSATFGRGDANETTALSTGGFGGDGFLVRFNIDGRY